MSKLDELLDSYDISILRYNFVDIDTCFANDSNRKNCLLSACAMIDSECNLRAIDKTALYGGMIGIDNSKLERVFGQFKLFRLHAVIHDACGFMKQHYDIGPGYSYVIRCPTNSCLVGHVTGLFFISYLKFFRKELYDDIGC